MAIILLLLTSLLEERLPTWRTRTLTLVVWLAGVVSVSMVVGFLTAILLNTPWWLGLPLATRVLICFYALAACQLLHTIKLFRRILDKPVAG